MARRRPASCLLALTGSSCLAFTSCVSFDAPEQAAAQRPTLSSDTATTADGTAEIEAGLDAEPDGALLTVTTLKYGAGDRTELFGTWIPWLRLGDGESGVGDLALGARHRFVEQAGARPSLGVQAVAKLPVASTARGLSSGETDVLIAGMATWTGPRLAGNLYYELGLLGNPDGAGVELAHLPALAGGLGLGGGFSAFGELAGVFVPARDIDAGFATLGCAWSPRPELIFDVGVRGGIGDEAPDVLFVVGFTWNLGRPSAVVPGF